jgi:hypothetical protein
MSGQIHPERWHAEPYTERQRRTWLPGLEQVYGAEWVASKEPWQAAVCNECGCKMPMNAWGLLSHEKMHDRQRARGEHSHRREGYVRVADRSVEALDRT